MSPEYRSKLIADGALALSPDGDYACDNQDHQDNICRCQTELLVGVVVDRMRSSLSLDVRRWASERFSQFGSGDLGGAKMWDVANWLVDLEMDSEYPQ